MRGFFIVSVFLLFVCFAVSAEEPIDPAKVVWDKNSEHGPWEDYQKPGPFNITSADRRRIIWAFVNDDPLGFIANEDVRFYIRNETEKMPDRDEYRKRLALAAYFTANNKGADYRSVLSNLDKILEEKFNKKISIDEAFDDVAKSLEPIDPAKVVIDREYIYNVSAADLKRVSQAFSRDDPLGFIADDEERFYMRNVTEKMPDRDEFRKRMALAAYFTANNKGADYRSVLSNLDKILEKKFNKKISIDEAFDDVIKSLGYSPRKIRIQKKIDSLRKFLTFEFLFPLIILGAVFCFVVWILRLIFRNRRQIIDFVKVCFSPEHYFQTSVLIIGSVIALSVFCIALKICF